MRIYKGKVKYTAGPPREGQYGPSINVLVTMEDGTTQRIYGKPGDAIERLKSGQDVQMVEDKGKFKLIEVEHSPEQSSTSESPTNQEDTANKVEEFKNRIRFYTETYRDIYTQLTHDNCIDKTQATAAASTIFISLMNSRK